MTKTKKDRTATGGGITAEVAQYFSFVGNALAEPNRDFSQYLDPASRMAMERKIKEAREKEAGSVVNVAAAVPVASRQGSAIRSDPSPPTIRQTKVAGGSVTSDAPRQKGRKKPPQG